MSTEDKELMKKLYETMRSYEMYNYINSLGNDRTEEADKIKYEVGNKVVNQLNNRNAIVERVIEDGFYIIKYDDNTKDIVLTVMIRSDTFNSKVGLGYSSSDKKKDAGKIPTSYQEYKKDTEKGVPAELGVSNSYPMLTREEPEPRLKLDSNKTSYGYPMLTREEPEPRLKLDANKTSYGYSMLTREKPEASEYVEEAELEAGDRVSTVKGNGTITKKIIDERGYVSYMVKLDNSDKPLEISKSDESFNMIKLTKEKADLEADLEEGDRVSTSKGNGTITAKTVNEEEHIFYTVTLDNGNNVFPTKINNYLDMEKISGFDYVKNEMHAKYLKYKIKYNLLKKEHNL